MPIKNNKHKCLLKSVKNVFLSKKKHKNPGIKLGYLNLNAPNLDICLLFKT